MSTVIDTTAVKDTDKVRLRNLTKNPAVYITPATGIRREIPALGYIEVTAGEVRECSYDVGCSNLLRNYVQVCNRELARELGVSDDMIEYNWGDKEVTAAVTTADMDVLLDALDFAPAGIKQAIVDKAVELAIPDMDRREAIEKAMNININRIIENKKVIDAASSGSSGSQQQRRRKATGSTQTRTRRAKSEAAK